MADTLRRFARTADMELSELLRSRCPGILKGHEGRPTFIKMEEGEIEHFVPGPSSVFPRPLPSPSPLRGVFGGISCVVSYSLASPLPTGVVSGRGVLVLPVPSRGLLSLPGRLFRVVESVWVSSSKGRSLEMVEGFFPLLPVFGSLLPVFVLWVVSD